MSGGHALNRAVVREEIRGGAASVFCPKCGENLTLPKADEPIHLTQTERRKVDEQQWLAARRSRFEQAISQSRVFADFRNERAYFITAFDLILDLYGISHGNHAVADLRESLRESEMR